MLDCFGPVCHQWPSFPSDTLGELVRFLKLNFGSDMCQANVLSCSLIIVVIRRDVLIMAFFKSFV